MKKEAGSEIPTTRLSSIVNVVEGLSGCQDSTRRTGLAGVFIFVETGGGERFPLKQKEEEQNRTIFQNQHLQLH